jgi:predicted RNA-binding Zn-ribbon protein involved in translation (DUF1610 family)
VHKHDIDFMRLAGPYECDNCGLEQPVVSRCVTCVAFICEKCLTQPAALERHSMCLGA